MDKEVIKAAEVVVKEAAKFMLVYTQDPLKRAIDTLAAHIANSKGSKRVQAARRMEARDVWGYHPKFSREDWRAEVRNKETNLGYWDWVEHRIEAEEASK